MLCSVPILRRTFVSFVSPVSFVSFVTERDDGIDARGTTRRQPAGENGSRGEH